MKVLVASTGRLAATRRAIFGLAFALLVGTVAPAHALAWHCTLSASPTTIQSGDQATLSWTTVTPETVSFTIDNGVGSVTPVPAGSTTVSPTADTTYTGTAQNATGGTITCSTTIKVTPPPPPKPTCTLAANPTSIAAGGSSSLSWTTTNSTSFEIDNGVGSVTPVDAGSTSVSPANDTTYTGTATGPGGSVTCTAPITVTHGGGGGGPTLSCTLSANPDSVSAGGSTTLTWTTTDAASFSIDNGIGSITPVSGGSTSTPAITSNTTFTGTATASNGNTVTCAAPVTIPVVGCTNNCGGGGGGGGNPSPHVLLSALPHVGEQPLAYLYLSQIPYTGLSLGTVGTIVYWAALIAWTLALAYLVLFGVAPAVNRSLRAFGLRIKETLAVEEPAFAGVPHLSAPRIAPVMKAEPEHKEPPRGYSSYDGFKSFAQGGSLSIDDIVKGLAKSHAAPAAAPAPHTEPIYENVEPIYQPSEPTMTEINHVPEVAAPAHIRGFVAALTEGDRAAVFSGLRQHVRGGGAPERLISDAACLLDDAYRARVDGAGSDADIARLVARLDTPTLERLVASLTTAIDSSYTASATGAKMALTRALGVLGA